MKTLLIVKQKRLGEILLTLPSSLWLGFFFLLPALIVFAFALKPSDFSGGLGSGWSLDTLKSIFSSTTFIVIFRTLWMGSLTTMICLALAIPTAYFIARAPTRIRHILLLLIVMPSWSSFIVRIFAWKSLLHPEGFFRNLLVMLHIINPDTILLYNSVTVILVMVYTYLPFAILPIYAAATKFNFQLFEAAMDLGMYRLQVFFNVFIPGIRKQVLTAIILVIIPALGCNVIPDVVGGPNNEMIGNKIVQKTFIDRNLPQASALAAFLTLAILMPFGTITLFRLRHRKHQQRKVKS